MKMKKFVGLLLACGLLACSYAGDFSDDGLKLEYVKHATKCMRPYELEDQVYWATNWSVAAVFFDLNRDGRLEEMKRMEQKLAQNER